MNQGRLLDDIVRWDLLRFDFIRKGFSFYILARRVYYSTATMSYRAVKNERLSSYTKNQCVSDDECPRYRFSVLLGSTSLVQTFHLASSLHVLLFRKNAICDTILSLVRSLSLYVLADDVLSSPFHSSLSCSWA